MIQQRSNPHPLPGVELIRSLRASYYFMGAFLGKSVWAVVGFPGAIISATSDRSHIKGFFKALGAKVVEKMIRFTLRLVHEGLPRGTDLL